MDSLRIAAVILSFASSQAFGAALIDREGRFEWNWSTGNVRFYGTSLSDNADGKTWRPAEQRAWSDGLSHVERQLPQILSSRIGLVSADIPQKFSKLLSATRSVNTTYYGDNRVKVTLETPLVAAIQEIPSSPVASLPAVQDNAGIILKVPKNATPALAFSVVDESGRELVAPKQILAAMASGAKGPRWFKGSASAPDAAAMPEQTTEIKVSYVSKGILKVQSSDWRPEFASLITGGRAAVVIQ